MSHRRIEEMQPKVRDKREREAEREERLGARAPGSCQRQWGYSADKRALRQGSQSRNKRWRLDRPCMVRVEAAEGTSHAFLGDMDKSHGDRRQRAGLSAIEKATRVLLSSTAGDRGVASSRV